MLNSVSLQGVTRLFLVFFARDEHGYPTENSWDSFRTWGPQLGSLISKLSSHQENNPDGNDFCKLKTPPPHPAMA